MPTIKTDWAHAFRVAELSRRIAQAAGLHEPLVLDIGIAALLHDIGKTRIPSRILLKPGKLTPAEYTVMKTHTVYGHKILDQYESKSMRLAATIALTHHERLDGSGYMGFRAEQIGIPARIVAIADVFDALCNDRPYKKATSAEFALNYLQTHAGSLFDSHFIMLMTGLVAEKGKI